MRRIETLNYIKHVDDLLAKHPVDEAMALAVGGDYDAVGRLESAMIRNVGFPERGHLIDVGCGSGRAGFALRDAPLTYLGTDVVEKLIAYARVKCGRDDWRFVVTDGLTIPEDDGRADLVTFFSVFTHLRHEESWIYLREARRVLRPGGRILFSFLDFDVPFHWSFFESAVAYAGTAYPATVFVDPSAVRIWAEHLDLDVVRLYDAREPFFTPEFPFFGHSFALLERPA